LLCSDVNLNSIIKEQYYLSRKCGVGYAESENMPDFERYILVSLYMKEIQDKNNQLKG